MTTYYCDLCGDIPCQFTVPETEQTRFDIPNICPWLIVETHKKSIPKSAKWVKQ